MSKKNIRSLFFDNFRYFILLLGLLCLTSISSNMISLNFTFICMDPADNKTIANVLLHHYTQNEKSMLNLAVGLGSIVGTFPFSWSYTQFGARFVFMFAGVTSTMSTIIIPWVTEWDFWAFIAARFFQGISYAGNFACIGIITSIWGPLKETGIFLAVLTCFTPISSLITNPVAGILCETLGWPSVYYVNSTASAIFFVLWYTCYLDKPQKHSLVSNKELGKIHKDKSIEHINMDGFVPYWEICKNPIILTIWFNALADIGTLVFLLLYSPTYFANVLKFGIAKTGFLGMISVLLMIVIRLMVGISSDKIEGVSEKKKLIFFNSFALLPSGILFLALGYVPQTHPWIAFWITVVINICLGANCGGFYKCATLVSRQYSHFVIANIQFIKCLTLLAAPALVSIFVVDDKSIEQWRQVFIVMGVLLLSANTLFCFMATDKPGAFTKITKKSREASKDLELSNV